MQYLRRSIAFFFALQQLKLDFASMSCHEYQEIFLRMQEHDPGLQSLLTRVVKAKQLLLPFIHYRDKIVRLVNDVDNILLKHPLYSRSLTESLLVHFGDILKMSDRYVRQTWTHDMRCDEVHFMFSLLSLVKYNQEALANRSAFPNFNVNFIEDEAFLVLKEYGEDYGIDSIYLFYQLAFTALPKKGSKEKRTKP